MSEICILRGDVVDHPKYRGRKIFSAGINLTHLYRGKIPYLWYIRRDMGIVNKVLRGLAIRSADPTKSTAARTRSHGSQVSTFSPSAGDANICWQWIMSSPAAMRI